MERQREREVKKSKVVWSFGSNVQVVEGDIIFSIFSEPFMRVIYIQIYNVQLIYIHPAFRPVDTPRHPV